MAAIDIKKLSRHESCLSKTQPRQGNGLVFDSGKPFSQNTAKKAVGETEQFSAGMFLTNLFLVYEGTHGNNLIRLCRAVTPLRSGDMDISPDGSFRGPSGALT
jgi:hypothetical protein